MCFPSLNFWIIQEQSDVFDGPADIVISSKLKNTKFHVSDVELISDGDEPFPSGFPSSKGTCKLRAHVISYMSSSMSKQVVAKLQAECGFLQMTIGWNDKIIPIFRR